MRTSPSSSAAVEQPPGEFAIDQISVNLLIEEARQRQRRRWSVTGVVFIVVAVLATIIAVQISNSSTPKGVPATPIKSFEASLEHGSHERFVATYRVNHFGFFPAGTIGYAQIPSPLGTKAVANANGYSATGRYSYVFRGHGRIVQWIQIATNVSACLRVPAPYFAPLRCDRPSPYAPSNGYATAGVGLIQPTVQSFDLLRNVPQKSWRISTVRSGAFGRLQCLTLLTLNTKTCINSQGIVVSWVSWNGSTRTGRVSLLALNHHPIARDFRTLTKPTSKFFLPPE
jgi:hypothetical protein